MIDKNLKNYKKRVFDLYLKGYGNSFYLVWLGIQRGLCPHLKIGVARKIVLKRRGEFWGLFIKGSKGIHTNDLRESDFKMVYPPHAFYKQGAKGKHQQYVI